MYILEKKKKLFDFKALPDTLIRYYVDPQNNTLYLLFKHEIWAINFATGKLENKVMINQDLDIEKEYFSAFHGNILYSFKVEPYTDKFNMILKEVDVTTGASKEYNWGNKYPISGQPTILGFWQNQPLINLSILRK